MERRRKLPEGVDPVVRELARTARRVAEHVIDAVQAGRPADRELSRISAFTGLVHPRDSRFVSRAVFAAFRWWGWTRDLLKQDLPFGLLASYLVDSGPYHVVTTDWAKRYHLQGATLEPPHANAGLEVRAEWLRVFLGGPKKKFNPLALVPAWFFKHLHNPHGRGFERSLLETFQKPAPLWIRVAGPVEDLEMTPHPRIAGAAKVTSEASVYENASFKRGAFEVQDLASQAVGIACAPRPGQRWWDACAGGGGKALQLAALMANKGLVVATDVKEHKLDETRRRAARAKLHNLTTRSWDGKRVPAEPGSFDGVLVDAPCSGVGTWRRNPDARWRTSPQDVAELSEKQGSILRRAAEGVKVGGRLVYAVCTLTKEETLDVVEAFLKARPDFELLPSPHPLTGEATDGRAWIWPPEHDSDGMFIATFTRTAADKIKA